MRTSPHIVFCAALSLALMSFSPAFDASGQQVQVKKNGKWSGEFSFYGGASLEQRDRDNTIGGSFFTNMNGGASARAGYASGRFYLNANLSGVTADKVTARQGVTADLNVGEQKKDTLVKANVEQTDAVTKSFGINGGLNAGWHFDERNRLDVSYGFDLTRKTPQKMVISTGFNSDIGIGTSSISDVNLKFSTESTIDTKSGHSIDLKYVHTFDKPGRVLEAVAGADIGFSDNSTEYDILSSIGTADTARTGITRKCVANTYYDDAASLRIKYTDRQFADISGLDADFWFRVDIKGDADMLSESVEDSVLVEKVENFRNHEYKPAPGCHLTYTAAKFSADISYSPQFFFYHTSSDYGSVRLSKGTTSHFIDLKGAYKPWTGHTFSLVYKRDEIRPSYLQLCPLERVGNSSNETIEGNPDLMPAVRNRLSLLYNYGHGRFSASLEAGLMHEKRKIVQQIVIILDPQTRVEKHRIRTWENAEDGYTAGAGLSLAWTGSVIKADMSANLNYFYGLKQTGDDVRSSDWSCRGGISYLLKSWIFNATLNYQSKIIRQYSSMTEIIGLDLKVEKKFGRFGVCLEGRNLLDRNVMVFTESDDGLRGRYEDEDYNNRLVCLGLRYAF